MGLPLIAFLPLDDDVDKDCKVYSVVDRRLFLDNFYESVSVPSISGVASNCLPSSEEVPPNS